MLLIIATISVLGVLVLFIWDTSRDQETNSNIFSFYTPFIAESIVVTNDSFGCTQSGCIIFLRNKNLGFSYKKPVLIFLSNHLVYHNANGLKLETKTIL